jgi:hypothetical protein
MVSEFERTGDHSERWRFRKINEVGSWFSGVLLSTERSDPIPDVPANTSTLSLVTT